MAIAARTARSASSPSAIGRPKTASTASPINLSMLPASASMHGTMAPNRRLRNAAVAAAPSRRLRPVKPRTSATKTVAAVVPSFVGSQAEPCATQAPAAAGLAGTTIAAALLGAARGQSKPSGAGVGGMGPCGTAPGAVCG
ncbi:hypothetical protein DF3PA_110071 [Candidatus Defluviicoccus seviourii]|uniref:Uncharacterized protein n=1 Tax=Candidatus Defluviicoccus seviourii TaxID=2565273 RepID=A0A564WB33_9PROT|nr:hypothetical protein DF3PA_110071 [Candidatus Defluviicoccus seviourii]